MIPRVKFFTWLILLDKLNTKSMLARRNFNVQPNCLCVMCNDGLRGPSIICSLNVTLPRNAGISLGFNGSMMTISTGRLNVVTSWLVYLFFMEIFLIAAWELWKIRNRLVFYGIQVFSNRWFTNFKEEAALQSHRIRDSDRVLVRLWLDAL